MSIKTNTGALSGRSIDSEKIVFKHSGDISSKTGRHFQRWRRYLDSLPTTGKMRRRMRRRTAALLGKSSTLGNTQLLWRLVDLYTLGYWWLAARWFYYTLKSWAELIASLPPSASASALHCFYLHQTERMTWEIIYIFQIHPGCSCWGGFCNRVPCEVKLGWEVSSEEDVC